MALKKFKTIKMDGMQEQKFQYNVKEVLDSITSNPLLDGVLLINVSLLASVTNEINHKLGRNPLGWIITRQRSQADIWDLQDTNTNRTSSLSIACSTDVIVDIWIF